MALISGVILILLVTVLALIPFFKRKGYTLYIALGIGTVIVAIGIYDLYQKDKEKEFTITSLERIGTTISWKESSVTLRLMNTLQDENPNDISVDIKLYSYRRTLLPPTAEISMRDARLRSTLDKKWGYHLLVENDAALLFNSFAEPDKSIYQDKEKAQYIQNLRYLGEAIDRKDQSSNVVLKMYYGPDAQSHYVSLRDLNDVFFIVCIKTGSTKNIVPAELDIHFKTNQGEKLISLPIRISTKMEQGINKIDFMPIRYIGIYFPEKFFGIARGSI